MRSGLKTPKIASRLPFQLSTPPPILLLLDIFDAVATVLLVLSLLLGGFAYFVNRKTKKDQQRLNKPKTDR
jgi:hypothetical protein